MNLKLKLDLKSLVWSSLDDTICKLEEIQKNHPQTNIVEIELEMETCDLKIKKDKNN